MIRIVVALATLAVCGTAQAQPAPRVVFDVDLPATDGFALNHDALGAHLAVSSDGVHYVLQHQYARGTIGLARAARIDLVVVAPDGALKLRRTLPVDETLYSVGFALASLGVAVAQSGDPVIFLSATEQSPTGAARAATLLRLGADGSVKKSTAIGPAKVGRGMDHGGGHYHLSTILPTRDNALVLGGGFGPVPYGWWMGKFSLDGVRIWQAGGAPGFMARVSAIGQRADGSWVSLASDTFPGESQAWDIRRHAADGKTLRRWPGPSSGGHAAAVLRAGSVFATTQIDSTPPRQHALIFVDDAGRVGRRVPWPFPFTYQVIADGDGLAAIVDETTRGDTRTFVVRVDAQGAIRWRAEAKADEIVRTSDGQIAGLVRWGKEREQRRLVRFADP